MTIDTTSQCQVSIILKLVLTVLTVLFIGTWASNVHAAPFVAIAEAKLLAAPVENAKTIVTVPKNSLVEAHAMAGPYYKVSFGKRFIGYLPMTSLERKPANDGNAQPLIVEAPQSAKRAVVVRTAVLAPAYGGDSSGPKVAAGQEIEIMDAKVHSLQVRLETGYVGWINEAAVLRLRLVTIAGDSLNKGALREDAPPLALAVWLERQDGQPINDETILHKGDGYRIKVKANRNCYIRIIAETPELGGLCQFYPNHFPGFNKSFLLTAGKVYSTEFMPSGMLFQVGNPIGSYDLIRVEANTRAPFVFMPFSRQNEACKQTKHRGGAFMPEDMMRSGNPLPEVIVEQKIRTME